MIRQDSEWPNAEETIRAALYCFEGIQLQLERMDVAAEKIEDGEGIIVGYKFKTGAWHCILGMLRGGDVSCGINRCREWLKRNAIESGPVQENDPNVTHAHEKAQEFIRKHPNVPVVDVPEVSEPPSDAPEAAR